MGAHMLYSRADGLQMPIRGMTCNTPYLEQSVCGIMSSKSLLITFYSSTNINRVYINAMPEMQQQDSSLLLMSKMPGRIPPTRQTMYCCDNVTGRLQGLS